MRITDNQHRIAREDFVAEDVYKRQPLPDKTLKACREADAILLAAIGSPQYDGAAIRPEQGLLALRKELNLYANIRPVKIFDSLKHLSPLKPERIGE